MKTASSIFITTSKAIVMTTCVAALSPQITNAASYTNDFSGTGGNTAFTTETTDGQWAIGSGTYQNSSLVGNTASSASVSVAGIVGTSFTVSSQFTVTSSSAPTSNSSNNTLGFGLMGDATFTSGSGYYLADFTHAYGKDSSSKGLLRILSIGDSSDFTTTGSSSNFDGNTTNLAIQEDVTYTLSLTGTYNGSGHLELTFGLYDSTGTTQYGTNAIATDTTPLVGTNFGYRNRVATGGDLDVSFDNFSVANVPEPSAYALLAGILGLGSVMMRRRR